MKYSLKKILFGCMLFVFSFCLIPQNAASVAAAAKAPKASFSSYYVGASNQGFKPGDGNKLSIKVGYKLKWKTFRGTCRVRLRILNSDGKAVYQKLWTIKKSGSRAVKWTGKASKGNKAGVTAGTYVEGGFYKAEVAVRYQATGTTDWKSAAKQTRTFIIADHNANSGNEITGSGTVSGSDTTTGSDTTGNGTVSGSDTTTGSDTTGNGTTSGSDTTTGSDTAGNGTTSGSDTTTGSDTAGNGTTTDTSVPVYTGNKYIDYIAEQMITEAGITSDMTDDEKVKLIYHYMTTHFHHVHYNKSNSYKVYYKTTTKLKSEIAAYGKVMKKLKKAGKIRYDSVGSSILWNMKRRIGECNHHSLIFQILCRHVGIEAATCKGYYLNRNGTRAGHYWNSAVIDGKTYYYDVDVEIQNYGKGQGDYYWYKKTLKEAKKTHEFTAYDVY